MKSTSKPRTSLQLEQLETRLAPALLFSPTVVKYQDTDGDIVGIIASKPVWGSNAAALDSYFTFDSGDLVSNADLTTPSRLDKLDLTGLLNTVQGRDLSVTVRVLTKASGGDGLANVGEIDATGLRMSVISVSGDLTKVTSGDGARGLNTLNVRSLGEQFVASVTPPADAISTFDGNLGTLNVIKNCNEATVNVTGNIGKIYIGGNLLGGVADNTGEITATGYIGGIRVLGNINGGTGFNTGRIEAQSDIGLVNIHGFIVGGGTAAGEGDYSGQIVSYGAQGLGVRNIGGNFVGGVYLGGITGGFGVQSGSLQATGWVGKTTVCPIVVYGNITGGAGLNSGQISAGSGLGVFRGQSIIGGAGDRSGSLFTTGIQADMNSVFLNGSLKGNTVAGQGTGNQSGAIIATGKVGIKINGDLVGGMLADGLGHDVDQTGYIQGRQITRVTVGGSILAGFNQEVNVPGGAVLTNSGAIRSEFDIGPIRVGINIRGSDSNRVLIAAFGQEHQGTYTDLAMQSLVVFGSVSKADILAGYGFSDVDTAPSPLNPDAQIGPVTINGNFVASNLIAGVDAGPDALFGTADDFAIVSDTNNPLIVSKIGTTPYSVNIKGNVVGTDDSETDNYSIEAEWLVSLVVHYTRIVPFSLYAGPNNNVRNVNPPFQDYTVDLTKTTTQDIVAQEVVAATIV